MSASLALFRAKQAGVEITVDGDKLRLSASSPAPSAVLELLSAHKPEIIELLRRQATPAAEVDLDGPTTAGSPPCARAYTYERHAFQGGPSRSTPDPDPADWCGEYEDELPPAPDYGDESEHDAWLAGTPAAELWPAS